MAQLDEVVKACGYTEYHTEQIRPYYNDALYYLMDAGVPEEVAKSDKAIGCIARYVMDTFVLNCTAVNLSPFFFQRLKQLTTGGVSTDAKNTEG